MTVSKPRAQKTLLTKFNDIHKNISAKKSVPFEDMKEYIFQKSVFLDASGYFVKNSKFRITVPKEVMEYKLKANELYIYGARSINENLIEFTVEVIENEHYEATKRLKKARKPLSAKEYLTVDDVGKQAQDIAKQRSERRKALEATRPDLTTLDHSDGTTVAVRAYTRKRPNTSGKPKRTRLSKADRQNPNFTGLDE